MAPWYRALHPMLPREIDVLRPTQVASILGLDRVALITAVPLTDEMLAAGAPVGTRPPPTMTGNRGAQRLRRVVSG